MKNDSEINLARDEAEQSRVRLEEAFDSLKDSVKLSAELAELTAVRAIKTRRDQAINGIHFLERNRPLAMLAVYVGGFVLGTLLSDKTRSRPVSPVRTKSNEMFDGPLDRLRDA